MNITTPRTGPSKRSLRKEHRRYLADRGVDSEAALAQYGFFSVDHEQASAILGFDLPEAFSGLAIESRAGGYTRVRVDHPELLDGHPRYLAPSGAEVEIYAPGDVSGPDPLFVTEAPTKAATLYEHQCQAVGLAGVSTTVDRDKHGPRLNGSWAAVGDLKDRQVYIVFDADRDKNADVADGENRLGEALARAGAKVFVVRVDAEGSQPGEGPDDFIVRLGYPRFADAIRNAVPFDAIARVQAAAGPAELMTDFPWARGVALADVARQSAVAAALKSRGYSTRDFKARFREAREANQGRTEFVQTPADYRVHDGQLVKFEAGRAGKVVATGDVEIVGEKTLDDGDGGRSTEFQIVARTSDGEQLPVRSVTPNEMERSSWLANAFGSRIAALVGPSELNTAITLRSTEVRRTTTYTHTGWSTDKGGARFLHAGGAVNGQASVDLPNGLDLYTLPNGASDPKEAVTLLLTIRDLAPPDVGTLLLGAIAQAPLTGLLRPQAALGLVGPTGNMKTTLANLVLLAFGKFAIGQTTESWHGTPNAIEAVLFALKDVPTVVDDFVRDARGRSMENFNRVVRNFSNGQGRSRLSRDSKLKPTYRPRGLLISTGEELPDEEQSIAARLLTVRPSRDTIDLEVLSRLQTERARLPHATVAYVHFLASMLGQLELDLPGVVEGYRALYRDAGHARLTTALAQMHTALDIVRGFAKRRRYVTTEEARSVDVWYCEGLQQIATQQGGATADLDPVKVALETLAELAAQGRVRIPRQDANGAQRTRRDVAPLIGWRAPDGALLLLKGAAYTEIHTATGQAGKPLGIGARELWRRLLERGWLTPGRGGHPFEQQRRIHGQRRWLVELRLPSEFAFDEPGGGAVSRAFGSPETHDSE